jgi:tetratricopeptide (TPR) repeat protein
MDRRNALRMLGLAVSAASLPLPVIIDGDEQQRVASVLSAPGRVDVQTIEHVEAVLWHCARQDNVLGPQAVLNTVLAQRDLARALVAECPPALCSRMLSALSEALRLAGWASYNLNLFDNADYYYYEDARAVAHEAGNIGLGAFVLCQMSQLATWQGRPHTGIDQAVAAGQWAHRTDDLRLRAFASDMAARAYAADGQRDACLAALDTAHTTLTAAGDRTPSYGLFYDEALHVSFRGECHLRLGEADRAVSYAQQSLAALDRSCVRDVGMTTVDLGQAYAQRKEIDEAARLLGDAGDIAARNSSARLTERLQRARAMLQP